MSNYRTASVDLTDYSSLPGCPVEDDYNGDAAWLAATEQFIVGRTVEVNDPDYGPVDSGTIVAVTLDGIGDVTDVDIESDQSGKTYDYDVRWVELDA